MKVRYRGHHKAERKVWFYAHDETYRTNADEARLISDKKMMALKQSLVTKGFAREIKPYEPPKDVEDRVSRCFVDASSKRGSENMLDYPLTDHLLKFKFLNLCRSRFDHEVPNCDLYRMKTVKDVVVFYATPVRGVNSYDALIRVQDELPANLHILPEAAKFNPNDVTAFHKGVDAYPGLIDRIRGIRNQKNNPSQRTEFKWPDI
ncbi:39S ribosomal protein L50, mitochondrial [Halotydeus destructor]|nr:39S ribosomal protein L50, mitochondrial [Halotydeus destructor]